MGPSDTVFRARGLVAEWRGGVLVGAVLLAAGFACGDPYTHTNPYDPAVPVEIDIAGPDTLFSYGELAQYAVKATPSFPDSAFVWTIDTTTVPAGRRDGVTDTIVDGGLFLNPSGSGAFQSIAPPLEPVTLTVAIGASLGSIDTTVARSRPIFTVQTKQYRHSGYRSLVLTQRLIRIQLRCPDTHSCDTLAVGGAWSVWVDGFDALGHGIYATSNVLAHPRSDTPVATFAVRDTTIAGVLPTGIRVATVTARRTGSTWIIATRRSLVDSMQLVVQ